LIALLNLLFSSSIPSKSHQEVDSLPDRFTKEAETRFPGKSVGPIEKMVRRYYRVRKYDPATGGPDAADLTKLGISM
jgi:aldehyde:ferredoxin oxidoreductase